MGTIDKEQQEYARKILAANSTVRWTFVFVHRPVWDAGPEKNGWAAIEAALIGRQYTVFCGHRHHYQKYVRNGMNYYQLATTDVLHPKWAWFAELVVFSIALMRSCGFANSARIPPCGMRSTCSPRRPLARCWDSARCYWPCS